MPKRRRTKDRIIEQTGRVIDSLKAVFPGRTPVVRRSSSSTTTEKRYSPPTNVVPAAESPPSKRPKPSIYSEIVTGADEDIPLDRITDLAAVGFKGLKTTLRVIKEASDVCTPLKSIVGGILGVIDVMEMTGQNDQDYRDLEQRLGAVVSIVSRYRDDRSTASSTFEDRLESFSTALNNQVASIRHKYKRSSGRRAAESQADAAEIAVCYRTICYLFDAFQIETTLATEHVTQEILSHTLFDRLPQAQYAAYNASSPAPRRACTPKTRELVLADLVTWAFQIDGTKLCWLDGMAGTGKTTIAYTLSEILDHNQRLGASFFCSRLETDSSNVNFIFPTIAHELARRIPFTSRAIQNAIAEDRSIGSKSLRDQFRNLIVKPINSASGSLSRPLVIVIDALDECSDRGAVGDLMSILCQLPHNLQLKFFVTSRPEPQIREMFQQESTAACSKLILHDIEKRVVAADIATYAREELNALAKRKNLDGWPPEDLFAALVRLSGNLFIYAATACKYIGDGGSIEDRLIDMTNASGRSAHDGTTELDKLYNGIMKTAFEKANSGEKEEIKLILRTVVNVHSPLSVEGLARLLNIKHGNISGALLSLHSVIYVPSPLSPDKTLPVSTFHASFPDFVANPIRSGNYHLDRAESHRILALKCLELLQSSFQENTRQLEGHLSRDHISEGLAYACANWVTHVAETECQPFILTDIRDAVRWFLKKRILQWIECLGLLGKLDAVVGPLLKLESWAQVASDLRDAIIDVRRFVTENLDLINHYPHEIYRSALVWIPEQSYIRRTYASINKSKMAWKLVLGLRNSWGACEHVLKGHLGSVESVAFSPDGSRLVSASMDKTVRIWNAATGGSETELKGHSDWVRYAIFSPDGSRIVSASDDSTVRIWNVATGGLDAEIKGLQGSVDSVVFSPDGSHVAASDDDRVCLWSVATGELKAELEGHAGSVNSVAYSPNGRYLASASCDKTVRIWNITERDVEIELLGHLGSVNSAVFSPNGRLVASASMDKTVRIWDVMTGICEAELKGHSTNVKSAIFSPDGTHVASASDDGSINIWILSTKELKAELKGHIGSVKSVVFSSDGSRLVSSASNDNTARIWNVARGELEAELKGHSSRVNSVTFSPDGSRVVSASNDKTIHIWNAAMGQSEEEFRGHTHPVNHIVVSPDGKHVASASDDDSSDATVHIWDVRSSQWKAELKGHSRLVKSVTFSPDGRRLATGSIDQTVRLWNTITGQQELKLHGHSDWVNSVAFSPDGTRITSKSIDGAIRFWNAATGELQAELGSHSDQMKPAVFHPYDPNKGILPTIADTSLPASGRLPDHQADSIYLSSGSQPTAVHAGSAEISWIHHRESGSKCWIPPQYRNLGTFIAENHATTGYFGLKSGKVLGIKFVADNALHPLRC